MGGMVKENFAMLLTLTWWPGLRYLKAASRTERTIRNPQLAEAHWLLIADLFPIRPMSSAGGRPTIDPRPCLEGILWVLRTGARWKDLPSEFPSYCTCWRRFRAWTKRGVWQQAWARLIERLDELKRLDWRSLLADGTFCRAKRGALRSVLVARGRARRCSC